MQIAARPDVALTALTPERAVAYLEDRAAQVGQKTLRRQRSHFHNPLFVMDFSLFS
ncbi:MAG: hypothetical protein OXC69_06845 [Candidatus Tectomicrobia bacterium]|nr:hypothetical protein [Candidatus Tectomicrobia bacterium]